MEPLTKRQADVLAYVVAYHGDHHTAPTMAEIKHALGIGSEATVHKHLEALRVKGYVARRHHYRRATDVLVSRNATSEVLSAFEAGWEAALAKSGWNGGETTDYMAQARATWLSARAEAR